MQELKGVQKSCVFTEYSSVPRYSIFKALQKQKQSQCLESFLHWLCFMEILTQGQMADYIVWCKKELESLAGN